MHLNQLEGNKEKFEKQLKKKSEEVNCSFIYQNFQMLVGIVNFLIFLNMLYFVWVI